MADSAIVDRSVASAPKDYVVAANVVLALKAVAATFDGSGAGVPFLPAVQLVAPDGTVMWTAVPSESIAAGGSAVVSWFPGGGVDEDTGTSGAGGSISRLASPQGTLSIGNPAGPTTNVDMPATGVAAGSYGDSSHSAQVTLDSQGRVTAASSVAISGGAGTIGFEIGYDQITANVNVTSTNEAAPTTIISCAAHTFDGQPVLLTFYSPFLQNPSVTSSIVISLWEGATQLGRIAAISFGTNTQVDFTCMAQYRFTPTAGSHTYQIRAHVGSTTGTPLVAAGAGGVATYVPAFARFTKV